jgi:ABC-2 type transport system ATP-binding protein
MAPKQLKTFGGFNWTKPISFEPRKNHIRKNLSKKFGAFTAVNDISLMWKGEILVFSGRRQEKTTAMKMLIGISNPVREKRGGFWRKSQSEMVKKYWLHEPKILDVWWFNIKENITFFGGIYGLSKLESKRKQPIDSKIATRNVADWLVRCHWAGNKN